MKNDHVPEVKDFNGVGKLYVTCDGRNSRETVSRMNKRRVLVTSKRKEERVF